MVEKYSIHFVLFIMHNKLVLRLLIGPLLSHCVSPTALSMQSQAPALPASTRLYNAVKAENIQEVKQLLREPTINPNVWHEGIKFGFTPLYAACWKNNPAIVALLLAHPKVLPNKGCGNELMPPLMFAAGAGHLKVVRTLLACEEVSTKCTDSTGERRTVLDAACASKRTEMVLELRKHYPRVSFYHFDELGRSPLTVALYMGAADIAALLLSWLTEDFLAKRITRSVYWSHLNDGATYPTGGQLPKVEEKPLYMALQKNFTEVLQLLLSAEAIEFDERGMCKLGLFLAANQNPLFTPATNFRFGEQLVLGRDYVAVQQLLDNASAPVVLFTKATASWYLLPRQHESRLIEQKVNYTKLLSKNRHLLVSTAQPLTTEQCALVGATQALQPAYVRTYKTMQDLDKVLQHWGGNLPPVLRQLVYTYAL